MDLKMDVLQHVAFEGLAEIENWCRISGTDYVVHKIFDQKAMPNAENTELLVILGGPMSVLDDLPWLEAERQLIRELVTLGKPVLGICLGGQQIAKALGAEIFFGEYREAGWLPIQRQSIKTFPNLPEELVVFQWHGEQFELPEGAERLFSSAVCSNQGFVYNGNVIGFQFHFESTEGSIANILQNDADFLDGSPYTQTVEEIRAYSIPADNRRLLYYFLDHLKASLPQI